ncbi:WXG100 family type VII secretion target [Bacillus nitratireducens]|nr:WXG100 family type VII secretion target [Bacillus nitratireducens]
MVQIKVTPEMLEEVANRASNTRIALESIHNNLCNEIDHLCFQWIGASNQQFVQMFNDARPKAFTSINSIIQLEEYLKRIAEKFRNTDNQDVTMEEGAMCGKPSSEENGFNLLLDLLNANDELAEYVIDSLRSFNNEEYKKIIASNKQIMDKAESLLKKSSLPVKRILEAFLQQNTQS